MLLLPIPSSALAGSPSPLCVCEGVAVCVCVPAWCRNLGRVDEALAALDKALEGRPDFAEAHNNRGLTLLLCERREDALASFTAAVDANPSFMQGCAALHSPRPLGRCVRLCVNVSGILAPRKC